MRTAASLIVLVIGEVLLLGAAFSHDISRGIPFATNYAPADYGALLGLAGLAVGVAFGVAQVLSRRGANIASAVALASFAVGACAYVVYHAGHPSPCVPDAFRGYPECVEAFHEQLAFPFLSMLATIAAIFGVTAAAIRAGREP